MNGTIGAYAVVGRALANLTTFTDTSAVAGATYAYRVFASNAAGDSVAAVPTLVGPVRPTPAAPTNLVATLRTGPQVRLTFRDNASNGASELFFVIERADGLGPFVPIATAPRNGGTGNVTFFDTTALPGHTYSYRVAAVTVGSQSDYSNTAGATLPALPAAPSAFTATAVRVGARERVTLTWVDNATTETGFTIQRATNAGFTNGLRTANLGADVTSLVQNNLVRIPYYYRIRANNTIVGSSAWVNVSPFPVPAAP